MPFWEAAPRPARDSAVRRRASRHRVRLATICPNWLYVDARSYGSPSPCGPRCVERGTVGGKRAGARKVAAITTGRQPGNVRIVGEVYAFDFTENGEKNSVSRRSRCPDLAPRRPRMSGTPQGTSIVSRCRATSSLASSPLPAGVPEDSGLAGGVQGRWNWAGFLGGIV
jgi:hypothetical protein